MTQTTLLKNDIVFENTKHGGTKVVVYTYTKGNSVPTKRKALGIIKRYNDEQTVRLGHRFLSHDWISPVYLDGKYNESKVTRHDTLKQAMDRLLALA